MKKLIRFVLGFIVGVIISSLFLFSCGVKIIPHKSHKKLPDRKGMVTTPYMDIHKSALTKDQIEKYKQL